MKIVILDGHALNPGDLSWETFEKLGDVSLYESTTPDEIADRVCDAEIVITNKVPIGERELSFMPRCRYIGVLATGYNIVDVEAAHKAGIAVTNVPAYSTDSVAQLVFALLLEFEHKVSRHDALSHSGAWSDCGCFCLYEPPLVELAGKTFGIYGYGSIGSAVAKIAAAFGMRVLAYSRTKKPDAPVEWVGEEELFRRADYLSLHCPQTKETVGLLNAKRLSWLKPGAVVINTARGGLVDEEAVRDALEEGRLRGFLADVLSTEPPKKDNPLLHAKNCLVTPHIAWATTEARKRLMQVSADNLKAFLEGREQNRV